MQKIDSLIFDMDGTLWDAVRSYCKVWDTTAAELGVTRPPVTYDELVSLMGKPLGEICDTLMSRCEIDRDVFLAHLSQVEARLMPVLGGKLYPDVHETLSALGRTGRLFMVSNCNATCLDNFLDINGLKPLFTDWLCFGDTGVDKDVNIRTLVERYNLKRPVYVGDIQRDCDSTREAGIEFVWAAYGFGNVADPDYRIDAFKELLQIVSER